MYYSRVSLVGRSDFSFCVLRSWGQAYEKKVRPYKVSGNLAPKKSVLRKKIMKRKPKMQLPSSDVINEIFALSGDR